jgi:hypothetical protein
MVENHGTFRFATEEKTTFILLSSTPSESLIYVLKTLGAEAIRVILHRDLRPRPTATR